MAWSVTSISFLTMLCSRAFGVCFGFCPEVPPGVDDRSYIGLCFPVCCNMWPVVTRVTWGTEVFLGATHFLTSFSVGFFKLSGVRPLVWFSLPEACLCPYDSAVSGLSPWWLAPGMRRPQCHWNSTSNCPSCVISSGKTSIQADYENSAFHQIKWGDTCG